MVYIALNVIIMLAHNCAIPGCGSVLVMDGNMKNRWDVCYAKDAGFIEFDGLFGSIKTGCAATPGFKSRYCSAHENQACNLLHSEEVDEDLEATTGPTLRSEQPKKRDGEVVAEMILAKKITRKQTYYQVRYTHVHAKQGTFNHRTHWIPFLWWTCSSVCGHYISVESSWWFVAGFFQSMHNYRSFGLDVQKSMPHGNPLNHFQIV